MFLFKRNGIYYLEYSENGCKPKRISTGKKFKQETLQFLRDFDEQLRQKEEQRTVPIRLKNFSEQFLKYSEGVHTLNTRMAFIVTFRMLERHFGNVNLTEITTQELELFFTQRIRKSSPYAARKDFINLSSAFNKAVRDKQLRENPCKGIGKIRIPEKFPLFFSPVDFQVLLTAIDRVDIRDLVEFAGNTGLRQMELPTLRWEQVDLSGGVLILDNQTHLTKSKRVRTIPLNQKAQAILTRRKEIAETEFVSTFNHKQLTQSYVSHKFARYLRRIKLNPKLNFHSLRHSFASWLFQRGVSICQVSKLLGHPSVNVTAIYSHLQPDDLRESVNKLMEPTN